MEFQKTILVTGGTGYIGSHTCVSLLQQNYNVIVLDNLSNSEAIVVERIQQIAGKKVTFIEGDIRNSALLDTLFAQYTIDAVIHFAGLKAVAESMSNPLVYFDHNISGTVQLLKAMNKAQVRTIIFSSSATVYDLDNKCPLDEDMPATTPNNNYGYTKLCVEHILQKQCNSDPTWSIAALRYFNPVGAHPSGLIGENPKDTPNNLLPYLMQVAAGKREKLSVFGGDYPTPDGTGIRDYIHVMDLADAHIKALHYRLNHSGFRVWNVGTGTGFSVLQIVAQFEKVNNVKIPYEIVSRRAGDVAISFANPNRAKLELNWTHQFDLATMLKDSWNWQLNQLKNSP